MALIYCVECGGKVSTRVEVCIHCGSPVEPPTPQINCPDCGEDFAGSLEACPVCGGPVVVPESSEQLSEPPAEQDELTVTGAEPPEVMDVPHILYHENGQILMKGTKRNGELHGPCVTYYEDGRVSQRGTFQDGKKCGEWLEDGKTTTYRPCSGDEVIKQAAQPSQQLPPMEEVLEGEIELKDEHIEALANIKVDLGKLGQRSIRFIENEPEKGDLGGQAADFFNNSVNYFSLYHMAIEKRYDKALGEFGTQFTAFVEEKLKQYENEIKSMNVHEIERFDPSFLEQCADELSRMTVEIKKSKKIPNRASRKTW